MKIELSEIAFVIVAGTLLFVFLIFIIIVFFVIYQKRKTKVELERIEERQKFEKEILNAQTEIREETMRFISQELHDNIAQTLIVTHLTLNRIDHEMPEVLQTQKALQQTIVQVKLLSKALNTSNILEGGLIRGLEFEINRLKQLNRWNIDFFNDVQDISLSADKQLLIFRIFQELINNIIKHGQAKNIIIEFGEDSSNFVLSFTDDGNQYDFFDKANTSGFNSGVGLKGILNKAHILKADLEIGKNKKEGMSFKLKVPILE